MFLSLPPQYPPPCGILRGVLKTPKRKKMTKYILLIGILLTQSACMERMMLEKNPVPIVATRIMFVTVPHERFLHNLEGFFSVCDSAFKKSQIATSVVPLNIYELSNVNDENIERYLEEKLKQPMIQFKPEVLLFMLPKNYRQSSPYYFLKFSAALMPVDMTDVYLSGLQSSSSESESAKVISFIPFVAEQKKERNYKNGIKEGQKFLLQLKRHISTLH